MRLITIGADVVDVFSKKVSPVDYFDRFQKDHPKIRKEKKYSFTKKYMYSESKFDSCRRTDDKALPVAPTFFVTAEIEAQLDRNWPEIQKHFYVWVKWLEERMFRFEYYCQPDHKYCDDEHLFDCAYEDRLFNEMLYAPIYRQEADEQREGWQTCILDLLALLPYEATDCVESLLLCLLHLAKKHRGDQVDNNEDVGYLVPALQMAITGVLLVNQNGRKLWLYALNTILFNFEALFKLRNLAGDRPLVPEID